EAIHPRLNRVLVTAEGVDAENSLPAIVVKRTHPRFPPLLGANFAEQHHGSNRVMTIGKHVSLDDDFFTDGSLDRESPVVDLRFDTFDNDATLKSRIEL